MNFYTFKIRKSLMITFVIVKDNHSMKGKAANHTKMKLNGSGSCKRNDHSVSFSF